MVAGRLQEKSGYFHVVLSYKDNNGVRKQPWFRTGLRIRGNKKHAEEILLYYRMNFDVQSGRLNCIKYGNPEKQMNMLFSDYLLLWLEEIKITVAETTYAGYRYNVKNTIAPYFNAKGIRLSALSAYALNEFYQEQRKRVSANTVIRYHANIYKALSDAVKDGLIADNPAKKVYKPKAKQYIAEYYTKDELKALFKAVKGTKIEFAVLMAGFYGLRREEIVGLKWSAIHFEEKTITIKHTVVECNVDGKYQIVARDMGKTKKSIRTLPLIPVIEELLRQIKVAQEKDKEFFGLDYCFDDQEYIYRETNGRLMKPNTITRNFTRIIEKNKHMKKIRFHDLRHSCATLLRREGVSMGDIQKWLGHSQISTTEQIYAHFDYENHLQSAKRIVNALSR